ncbi:MAG: ABC transporter permease [Kofleriaceae bacterium]|nr:ABC transporter permease [Kofleriaceae bacterium]MCL4228032.1 ABC transporter permease subunit [Myxococcales bacterium]
MTAAAAARPRFARQVLAAARLDAAEILRSRWLLFCAGAYALLAVVFVLVGLRESTVLGFTGIGRVLLSMCHALLLLLPLLALTALGPVIGRAREDGTLELLFSHPLSRAAWFVGVSLTRYLALVVPLVVLLVGLGLYGQLAHGQAVPWPFMVRALVVSAALLAAFAGVGLCISTLVRNPARVTTYIVLAWVVGVALIDFGLIGVLLRWRLDPQMVFTLAAINPVQDARMALLSGLEADLATLGPVGFYLTHRLGADLLYLLGVLWPALVGVGTWTAAFVAFRRSDLV